MTPLLRFTPDLFTPKVLPTPAQPTQPKPAPQPKPPVQINQPQPLHAPSSAGSANKEAAQFSHPRANREVLLQQTRVAYFLCRVKRRSLGLGVDYCGLTVRAPQWVALHQIDTVLQDKADWILQKLQQSRQLYERRVGQQIVWQDGTKLSFLGQPLTLQLLFDDSLTELAVSRQQSQLQIHLPNSASVQQIKRAAQAWFMTQAQQLFIERLNHFAPVLGVCWSRLALSNASTSWGSARRDGSIRLNWRLLHFDMAAIDYVVVHELSHLRFMDHSARFWDTVRSVLPDYALQRAQFKNQPTPDWT